MTGGFTDLFYFEKDGVVVIASSALPTDEQKGITAWVREDAYTIATKKYDELLEELENTVR